MGTSRRLNLFAVVFGISALILRSAAAALSISTVSEYTRPATPDGVSGLTYAGGNQYFTVDDTGALIYPAVIGIRLDTGAITSCTFSAGVSLGGSDLEGIAFNPASGGVLVSDETGAVIKECSTAGALLNTLPVPANLKACRSNFSLESLTMRGNGLELWTSNEEALYNSSIGVDDGPLSTATSGSVVRLTRFLRNTVHDAWTASGQWAYLTDPIEGDPYNNSERSGVADLCVLPDGTLLVLEREMSVKTFFPTFRSRIYAVSFSGATDVSGIPSLNGATYTRVTKTLLLNQNTVFSNYEGLCLGPRLNDGSLSLLLLADGDDSADETLYALKLTGLSARTVTVSSAYGEANPVGGPYRYVHGQTFTNTVTEPAPGPDQRLLCTGWTLSGHTPGAGAGTTCIFTVTNDAQLTWQWTTEYAGDLPIRESFETYPAGQYLDGVFGWSGDGVVTEGTYAAPTPPGFPLPECAHTKALRCDAETARAINGHEEQNVNVDFMLQAVRRQDPADDLSNTVQTAFLVDSNGLFCAWHLYHNDAGDVRRWTALNDTPIGTGQWVRVSIRMDYASSASGDTFFSPRLNGSLCPTTYGCKGPNDLRSPGHWYICANSPVRDGGGAKKLSGLAFQNGMLDDVVVTTEPFAHTGETATNGVPFTWFDFWGIARNPDRDSDADGFADAQEHTAGTDPTDPYSVFRVVATWAQDGYVYVQFTGNNSGSDTPYVMERASDLALGDWAVVDDAIPRAAAPQVINTWSEPAPPGGPYFYRPKALPAP